MMDKINNFDQLKDLDFGYVWAWSSWDGYGIWYWDSDNGLGEMAPTDMADHRRIDRISADMFPMYVIPRPPDKPETIDADVDRKAIA